MEIPHEPDGIFANQKFKLGGGPWKEKCWYILWTIGIFHSQLK
jgi:hypothetical protein